MADIVDATVRSRMMSKIRGRDTKAEVAVRKGLFACGYRYRLNSRLLGKPDIVLPKFNAVIFVHGCFWHGHTYPAFKWPKTNEEFWKIKIERNQKRDSRVVSLLEHQGWRVGIVWECMIKKNLDFVISQLDEWLQNQESSFFQIP